MKLLVTGGLGYIGSHTVIELINDGYEVVILDNLSNSKIEVLDKIHKITGVTPKFYNVDLLDEENVYMVFDENKFDGVIHFAGLKAVGESVTVPLRYYENNITGTINLLKAMNKYGVKKIVFSSSACVYGVPEKNPITEDSPSNLATNPYGRTKQFIEEILKDCAYADKSMRVTILRYFNPVGAHPSGLLGEDPNGIPNNLMPYIQRVAGGKLEKLNIFGNDYPTPDGTCIRDFIHVVDLARGHLKAMEKIDDKNIRIVNLGTGKGTSVLELVNTFNKTNGNRVKYEFAPRREGDVPVNYADPSKAKTELNWEAKLNVEDMCKDSWNFVQKCEEETSSSTLFPKKIIVASNNEHKIKEIKAILDGYEVLTLKDIGFTQEVKENGNSFEENAKIKALCVRKYANCGKYKDYIVLADDSGLCVKSLGGAPGIYSSRYSGKGDEGNRQKVLDELKDKDDRSAYFNCTIALSIPNGNVKVVSGKTYGIISQKKIGDESFGYDSLFFSSALGKTFGEASEEEKNRVSHRRYALEDAKKVLDKITN